MRLTEDSNRMAIQRTGARSSGLSKRPTDDYLRQILSNVEEGSTPSKTPEAALSPDMLEWLYWQERVEQWLAANATKTDILFEDLTREWEGELDQLLPRPTAGTSTLRQQDDVALTAIIHERDERLKLWAWERGGLLIHAHEIYRPFDAPPSFVLNILLPFRTSGNEDQPLTIQRHPKQPYGTRQPPFTPEHANVLSAPPVQAASEAMWAIGSSGELALVRRENAPPLVTTSNNVVISVGGSPTDTIGADEEAALWQAALALDDDTAATFWICMAKWFYDTAGDSTRVSARVHVSDILSFRGFKKQVAGGYKTVQKQEARDDIRKLNNMWVKSVDVIHEGTGRHRKPKTVYLESRLMEVAVETEDEQGQVPYAFRVRPGEWAAPYLTEDNRETALLLRPILQYDARQGVERMAMRIGLYLTPQWRTRAAWRNYGQSFKVETLLARTRLPIPTARQRYTEFREHFEVALDRLQADGVIGTRGESGALVDGWRYDKGDDDSLPIYKWFHKWLQWTVLIPPPASVLHAYASIGENRAAAIKAAVKGKRRGEAMLTASASSN